MSESIRIGLVSISDRASSGVYEDLGLPALKEWLGSALLSPWEVEERLIPDERPVIERTLRELVDTGGCSLVLTTGGGLRLAPDLSAARQISERGRLYDL